MTMPSLAPSLPRHPMRWLLFLVIGLVAVGAVTLGIALWPGEDEPAATQSVPAEVNTPAVNPPAEVIAEAPALTDEETDPQFGGITGLVLCTKPFPPLRRNIAPISPTKLCWSTRKPVGSRTSFST